MSSFGERFKRIRVSKGLTQDDMLSDDLQYGTYSNGRWSYRVNRSDHNYEFGGYTTYIYAYDSAGNETSTSAGATQIEEKLYLTIPDLTKISNTSTTIKLAWSPVEGADGYIILRKNLKSKEWSKYAEIQGGSITTYEDTNVSADARYYYTIEAYALDSYGNRVYSGYYIDGLNILKSVGTVELDTLTTDSGSNTITWKSLAGVQGYVVKRKANGGKWITVAVLKGDDRNTYTDSKAIYAGSEYTYTIFAMGKKKADGSKNYGGFDKDGLAITASVKTVALKNTTAYSNKNVVKWNKVNGSDGYVVMRKEESDDMWTIVKTVNNTNTINYSDTDIDKGTKYTYTVRAFYKDNTGKKVYGNFNPTGKTVTAK